MSKLIEWKGTPGVGDFMMGLNIAHRVAYDNNTTVDLVIHWYHNQDHLHHFEDPETIIERCNIAHNFYLHQSRVNIHHKFNSADTELWVKRCRGVDFKPTAANKINSWVHRPSSFLPINNRKVVIWRPTFNAEIPRAWKTIVSDYSWEYIIKLLTTVYDYEIVELTYRSIIKEAYYHISTCDFVISYDGMWHYIARNFLKPMIVFSENEVTRFHTPNAVMLAANQTQSFFNDFESNRTLLDKQLEQYKNKIRDII